MMIFNYDIDSTFTYLKHVDSLKEFGVSEDIAKKTLQQTKNDLDAAIARIFDA